MYVCMYVWYVSILARGKGPSIFECRIFQDDNDPVSPSRLHATKAKCSSGLGNCSKKNQKAKLKSQRSSTPVSRLLDYYVINCYMFIYVLFLFYVIAPLKTSLWPWPPQPNSILNDPFLRKPLSTRNQNMSSPLKNMFGLFRPVHLLMNLNPQYPDRLLSFCPQLLLLLNQSENVSIKVL